MVVSAAGERVPRPAALTIEKAATGFRAQSQARLSHERVGEALLTARPEVADQGAAALLVTATTPARLAQPIKAQAGAEQLAARLAGERPGPVAPGS